MVKKTKAQQLSSNKISKKNPQNSNDRPSEKNTFQSYLEKMTDVMPGNFYWKDKEGHYLGCNKALLEAINIASRKDFIGKTDFDLWPEQAEELRQNDIEVMRTREPLYKEEVVNLPKLGRRFFTSLKLPFLDENDNVIGIIGNSLDVTELKETQAALLEAKEKAEAANLAKDAFMENMSHDFKTPLNGIYGTVQLLSDRKPELPEDIQELITMQEKSTLRVIDLVDDILNYKKIASGTLEIVQEELNLLEIIESVVDGFRFQLKNKPVDIIICYPADVPRHLISDAYCVTSILLNLISNAVKFTDEGHISISVSVFSKEGDNIDLQIAVKDTGKGIPKDKYKEIFERFHRLELSNKGLKAGHGIGLSVVKELVDKLNGKVEVESEPGEGTKFTVNLPFQALDMAFFVSEWEKLHQRVRILIVSDKITSTETLFNQFEQAFISKTNSSEVVNKLEDALKNKNPFEILIVDDEINNPLELINNLHKDEKYFSLMKLLSLHPKQNRDKKWYDKAREMGCFDFIKKPILPSELDKKIVEAWTNWKNKK